MNNERAEWECSNCGKEAKVVRGTYRYTESELKEVILVGIELIRCPACGNEDPVLPNINGLMQILAQAVIEKPWRLAGNEIRFLRKYLKMTGEQFGRHIGVDKWCVSKWENGHESVGEPSDRAIRALALMLGDGLRESMERAARMFPDIKEAMREVEYRYFAETREVEYA
jgi:putative zinc finger/helix-turn-helix YgiT family protein